MMRRVRTAILTVAALCLATDHPLSAQRFAFDLDVPAGRSSFWRLEDLGRIDRLTGTFEVLELRQDRKWEPAFQLMLEGGGMGVSVSFVRKGGNGPLQARLHVLKGEERTGEHVIEGWQVERRKPFDLVLDWSQQGVLVVTSGGRERVRFRLDFVPTTLVASASTGEWTAEGLTLTSTQK